MKLSSKRINFSTAVSKLVLRMNELGVGVAYDQVKRCKNCETGRLNSVHKVGLAADLIFYIDGEWLDDNNPITTKWHNIAHDYWDVLGGSMRIEKDLNHYSFAHQGMW